MQACKNTRDKEKKLTNKVANELNKLGISKKTKQNVTGKKATLPTRDSFRDVKEMRGGGRGEGGERVV